MAFADMLRGALRRSPGAKSGVRVEGHQLGTIVFIAAVAAYLFLMMQVGTATPFLVTRGASMEPTYHQGDLLVRSRVAPAEIEVGDVIAFRVPENGQTIGLSGNAAHRVTEITAVDGQLVFQTQGDNGSPDAFQVPAGAVSGLVVRNLGRAGVLFLILTSRAFLLVVVVPLGLLGIGLFGFDAWSKGQKKEEPVPDAATLARRHELARWATEASVGLGDLEVAAGEPSHRPAPTTPKRQSPNTRITKPWEPALGEPVVEYDAASPPPPSRAPIPEADPSETPQ